MYESFFGLEDKPFNMTPDPRYLYLSESHEEALSALLYGIRENKGLITLTGPVGVGKTTILFAFLDKIRDTTETALSPAGLTGNRTQFLQDVCRQFQIPWEDDSVVSLTQTLRAFATRKAEQGKSVVFLVDETQDLKVEELKHFHYLNNLETPRAKLIQIILAGTERLGETLQSPELAPLLQRVAIRCEIKPLEPGESVAYILHRLHVAGCRDMALFTTGALWRIVHHSRGIPRVINVLCDNAMIVAYSAGKTPIEESFLAEVVESMEGGGAGLPGGEIVSREQVAEMREVAVRRMEQGKATRPFPVQPPVRERPGPASPPAEPSPHPAAAPEPAHAPRRSALRTDRRSGRKLLPLAGLLLVVALAVAVLRSRQGPEEASSPPQPVPPTAVAEPSPAEMPVPEDTPEAPQPDTMAAPPPAGAVFEDQDLAAIASERYGRLDIELLAAIRQANPRIEDWNRIPSTVALELPPAAGRGDEVDFYTVQMISYRSGSDAARTMADRLGHEGIQNVFVVDGPPNEAGHRWTSICTGVFVSAVEARPWLERVRGMGFADAFVLRLQNKPLGDILYTPAG